MIGSLQQIKSAVGLLNPDAVRERAAQPVTVGLIAGSDNGFLAMAQSLDPLHPGRVYNASAPGAPEQFDVLLYQPGASAPRTALKLDPDNPEKSAERIIEAHEELALPLASQFAIFRKPAIERTVQSVARENALFALATALPNIVPNLVELPWALGEFASDTAFLTMNQVRMAFLIAAANGRPVGYGDQKTEILSIGAGAFGWRAIARELAGKIPLGGGLIPKGAIAWAGTYVVGKGLEKYNNVRRMPSREERNAMYDEAYAKGREVAAGLRQQLKA